MDPMQQNLSDNFSAFIGQLAATQADRVGRGLPPLDFHIGVTTSSIFVAEPGACAGSPLSCNIGASFPAPSSSTACSAGGSSCSGLVDKYYDVGAGCLAGVAVNGASYPAGDFVAVGGNPKAIHFQFTDAQWQSWGTGTVYAPLQAAVDQFKQNVKVGSCGSGEEQHLEAGRLAVQKALTGQQGLTAGEWPHAYSKMVVVWIGNEDDCSNPKDPTRALVYSGGPGEDVCTADQALPLAQRKMFPVSDYAAYFAALGRPFGAAFIRPGADLKLGCNCPAIGCAGGGYSEGARFAALAQAFRDQGRSVVEGSICDASFATTLQQIADLVKPLEALKLPSQPASDKVIVLRIVDGADKTVHRCAGPDTAQEWWFVQSATPGDPSGGCTSTPTAGATPGSNPSPCVAIRKGGACEAAPGQSYVAEYLGQVPAGGCASAADCATALGGGASAWVCEPISGQARGTCLCAP
jgi:hypothetical protein